VVQVHPETGERALLIGGFVHSIEGFSTIDGARVLDILQGSVSKIENTVRWTWAPGDVAFWDNRTTQHYGVADYGDLTRHHQRITLAGGVPVSVDGESSVALVGDDSAFTPVS
jgi:taurine dioxygenase